MEFDKLIDKKTKEYRLLLWCFSHNIGISGERVMARCAGCDNSHLCVGIKHILQDNLNISIQNNRVLAECRS